MVLVLVMSGYGINCESESAHAFEKAGAKCDIVHINDLIAGKKRIGDYDIMLFPGGFSYGDDTGSGNAFANKLRHNLWEDVLRFIEDGKLILGICNGFQIMTRLGLFALPEGSYGSIINAMEPNAANRYECRWVHIASKSERCVFTKGIKATHVPVAHGEGRFVCEERTYRQLQQHGQIVFTYCSESGAAADGAYPANPNGAMHDVAAICDRSGRIMGMMPHPERGIYAVNDPAYPLRKEEARRLKEELPECIASNLQIFVNAVEHCRRNRK